MGDVDGLIDLYAEDAVYIAGPDQRFTGHEKPAMADDQSRVGLATERQFQHPRRDNPASSPLIPANQESKLYW